MNFSTLKNITLRNTIFKNYFIYHYISYIYYCLWLSFTMSVREEREYFATIYFEIFFSKCVHMCLWLFYKTEGKDKASNCSLIILLKYMVEKRKLKKIKHPICSSHYGNFYNCLVYFKSGNLWRLFIYRK